MFEAPEAVSPFTAAVVVRISGSRSSARYIVAELEAMLERCCAAFGKITQWA